MQLLSIQNFMDLISSNMEKARQDPGAVLDGQFKGVSPSGLITVWVDALGRVQRIHIAPGTVHDSQEKFLADEFMEANSKARHAAEQLEFSGSGGRERARNEQQPPDAASNTQSYIRPDGATRRCAPAEYAEDYGGEIPDTFLE